MYDLLGQIGKKDVEIIDRDLGFEICRMEGVKSIVLGSFIKAGDMFATDVKVLDVESKRLIKSASIKGEGVESILRTQIDELSKEISLGIGIAESEISASKFGITDVTTDSMDAYKYFLKGRENSRKFYFEEARPFLEKAVELDPQFPMAYLILANVYRILQDSKARDDAYKKAMTFSYRATEKERLSIEAEYANRIEKDQEKRFLILKKIAKKYPKEKDAHYDLAYYFKNKQLFHEAIEEYNKVLELDPNHGNALNSLGEMYIYLREYEEAIEYYEKYLSLYPGEANPLDSVGWCYFLMGRFDEALAKFKEALKLKPNFYYSLLSVIYVYALKENYPEAMKWVDQFVEMAPTSGRKAEGFIWKGFINYFLGSLDQSLSDLSKASEIAESEGNAGLIAFTDRIIGLIYCKRGKFKLSRQHLKSWFDFSIENYPQYLPRITAFYSFYLGLVDLEERQFNSAKSRLAEIESILLEKDPDYRDWITFYRDLLNGQILLAENEIGKAIAVCKEASHLGGPPLIQGILPYNIPFLKDVLARAYLNNAEIDKAIAEYEGLITFGPTRQDRCLIHPKYHYRLAKLYEQKGWIGKAIDQFEKFLSLWKEADPGIAEVEDAKKRLAGLKGE
jgi:tetratricopeptide (TPR) repeat protein